MITIENTSIKPIKEYFRQLKNENILYLCGYGLNGKILEKWFVMRGIPLKGVIDKCTKDTEYSGVSISYEDATKSVGNAYYIISSGSIYYKEMHEQLIKLGVPTGHVIRLTYKALYTVMMDLNTDIEGGEEYLYDGRFHDIYKGKRAFFIGNGPSLKIEDLDKLKDEITFATNLIYGAFPYTDWRPTFFVLEDRICAKDSFGTVEKLEYITNNVGKLLCSELTYIYGEPNLDRYNNLFFYKPLLTLRSDNYMPFSEDVREGVVIGEGTSVYTMYQFAVDMGISEIYLLGMDCSYPREIDDEGNIQRTSDKKTYASFISDVEDDSAVVANHKKMIRDHMSAKQFADLHGIKIYNATRGGELEVFPRVDFDSLV
ncbi:MAG: DUF115 domain-containing protein [Lachnospiraceae bacterium]|nr:DUF115 domain-containing protein [Lachnospiraceae bacterium]